MGKRQLYVTYKVVVNTGMSVNYNESMRHVRVILMKTQLRLPIRSDVEREPFLVDCIHLSPLILDPLDSRRASNASNDRANDALRPVSNAQQMPPPIHTLAFSAAAFLREATLGVSSGINYIRVASPPAPYMIDH